MKASELMVGNWVRCKIYNGNKDAILPFTWQEAKYIHLFEPIPLTPEILEKCGFENKKQNGLFELIIGRVRLNLIFVNSEDSVYFITSAASSFGMVHFPHQRHLHQLQNLFYALTGEELNYQP